VTYRRYRTTTKHWFWEDSDRPMARYKKVTPLLYFAIIFMILLWSLPMKTTCHFFFQNYPNILWSLHTAGVVAFSTHWSRCSMMQAQEGLGMRCRPRESPVFAPIINWNRTWARSCWMILQRSGVDPGREGLRSQWTVFFYHPTSANSRTRVDRRILFREISEFVFFAIGLKMCKICRNFDWRKTSNLAKKSKFRELIQVALWTNHCCHKKFYLIHTFDKSSEIALHFFKSIKV
jgi:hypothetical protein